MSTTEEAAALTFLGENTKGGGGYADAGTAGVRAMMLVGGWETD